jgi:hypothetical protein
MIVVPPGSFVMGSPPTEKGRFNNEGPQHPVTVRSRFDVVVLSTAIGMSLSHVGGQACRGGVNTAAGRLR